MTREFISAKYDADTLTVDFFGNDGTHLVRTGGSIAWRFNNPGNITNKAHGTGHVTFVYGKTAQGDIAALGGNQNNRLKLSPYKLSGISAEFELNGIWLEQKFHAFYVPVTYEEYAKSQPELK